jgi:hypothetical protein
MRANPREPSDVLLPARSLIIYRRDGAKTQTGGKADRASASGELYHTSQGGCQPEDALAPRPGTLARSDGLILAEDGYFVANARYHRRWRARRGLS